MASQPAGTGRDRNQVRPLRSTVSSVRGKANRHRSTGVSGSHFVLDCGGSRKQAARFQDLLQQPPHPYLNGRANAESACVTTNRKSPLLSMATSLSILISDTSGCVIFRRLSNSGIRSTSGRLPIKSSGACVRGCCAVRGSDRLTPTVSIRQRQVTPLSKVKVYSVVKPRPPLDFPIATRNPVCSKRRTVDCTPRIDRLVFLASVAIDG